MLAVSVLVGIATEEPAHHVLGHHGSITLAVSCHEDTLETPAIVILHPIGFPQPNEASGDHAGVFAHGTVVGFDHLGIKDAGEPLGHQVIDRIVILFVPFGNQGHLGGVVLGRVGLGVAVIPGTGLGADADHYDPLSL